MILFVFMEFIKLNILLLLSLVIGANCQNSDNTGSHKPVEIPRIDFIETSPIQPHENNPDVIWYDDFSESKDYLEAYGGIDDEMNFGTEGGAMEAGFNKGDVDGKGNRKVAFGDFPANGHVVRKGEQFDQIYWRVYVKHEYGWEGAPAKMSRATSIVAPGPWRQAMIAHVWNGDGNILTLDPASGVEGQTDSVKTTRYNDFENLDWLGNKPASQFNISATEESGYWVLVESMVKLNTPGKSDGINLLWIDGRLEAERRKLNLRGSYTGHGVNAVFLESYWNSGAVKTQNRWFDNFVISTQPIGPVYCPANPVLHKTTFQGPGELEAWELELAADFEGRDVVFRSINLGIEEKVTINEPVGRFSGSLAGKKSLKSGETYFCRVRQKSSQGNWSDWSRWHQGFKVE